MCILNSVYSKFILSLMQTKKSHADILKKLSSNGEFLQNSTSTLLLEMKVLNKLIFKSRNTHSKEKFFKGLERVSIL